MRILIEITHPAHVHFFRNAIDIWKSQGHEVAVTARDKEIVLELEWIIAKKDVPRLLGLAKQSKADYIITPNNFPRVTSWTLATQDRFWRVYKKP